MNRREREKRSSQYDFYSIAESQQPSEVTDRSTPPALLTTIPPVGISTRPTAVVAPAGPMRSISAFFSGGSAIRKGNGDISNNLHEKFSSKTTESPSAFQPINIVPKTLPKQTTNKSAPVLMDISQHKALERGQQLTKVHISHPQSSSIVHVNLLRRRFDIHLGIFLVDVT